MSDNLPPGVSVNDLPGNTPEDMAWERLIDRIIDSGLTAEEATSLWLDGMARRDDSSEDY